MSAVNRMRADFKAHCARDILDRRTDGSFDHFASIEPRGTEWTWPKRAKKAPAAPLRDPRGREKKSARNGR